MAVASEFVRAGEPGGLGGSPPDQIHDRKPYSEFKHPIRPGGVPVAGKPSDDLAPGTLRSIEKQSGVLLR
ncbi:type II toxin-antitoxin system HicA family toxin [Vulcanococcus limneticus]|uniref:type II toxin-antitoxin system HicA family toxin n=1 Tax=Vulcanococcus limneticus TaxID=2170428 RepID=UPI00398BEDE5